MTELSYKRDDHVHDWTLIKHLGSGGNSEVWRARVAGAESNDEVALKILTKEGNEALNRFVREVEVNTQLPTGRALPIIESRLPGQHGSPFCFSMPIGQPMNRWRGETRPDMHDRAHALGQVARCLSAVHELEPGYAHRDIKPGNILRLGDAWVLGDFGLVTGPELSDLSGTGEIIGPRHYLAPEVLRLTGDTDWQKCDVYSFGQLIWWMISDQRYPLGYPHDLTQVFNTLRHWTNGFAHIGILDHLVYRCTRLEPDERPTMVEVVEELDGWLNLPLEDAKADVDSNALRFNQLQAIAAVSEEQIKVRKHWENEKERVSSELCAWLEQHLAPGFQADESNIQARVMTNTGGPAAAKGWLTNDRQKVEIVRPVSHAVFRIDMPIADGGTIYLNSGFDLALEEGALQTLHIWAGFYMHDDNSDNVLFGKHHYSCQLGSSNEVTVVTEAKNYVAEGFDNAFRKFNDAARSLVDRG